MGIWEHKDMAWNLDKRLQTDDWSTASPTTTKPTASPKTFTTSFQASPSAANAPKPGAIVVAPWSAEANGMAV
ncbi:hypothetical protein PMIN02_004638 [Paraphaeosphaeria minitans]